MQEVQIKPFMLIGISIRTSNKDGRALKDIGNLWTSFMSNNILDKIPNKLDNTIYSLYTDYASDHTEPYTVILGCKVEHLNEIPAGMTGKSFDGGKYLLITAIGNLMEGLVAQEWMKIWNMELDRDYVADFETYGESAANPHNAEVNFFIGLK